MDNNLRFCIVGRGSIGTRHIKNLKTLSCNKIIAFSEEFNKGKEDDYRDKYGIETFYNVKEVAEFNPDAFVIANPTAKHIKFAKIAVELNSHVFLEKPISHNLSGLGALKKKVREKKIVFFLANNFRFHPVLLHIKKFIENGEFGDLYFARIQVGQYLPDWHPWEDYRQSYSARKDLGGGVVLTLQHEIDYAYWLFGKIKGIKACVKKISDLEIDVEDIASVIAETESGLLLEIHLDYLQRPPKRTIQIHGSKGSVDYTFGDAHLRFYDFKRQRFKHIIDLGNYEYNKMYIDEMKHFIRCLSGKEKPRTSIDDAIYVLKTCLEIKKGIKE